eukprot:453880_1
MAVMDTFVQFVDEIQETIVNKKDLREPVHEFNNDCIYECIGQLRMVYDYSEHGNYRPELTGTGTIFFVQNTKESFKRKAFILTAAHNIRHRIVHCKKCDFYMEKRSNCRGCGEQLTKDDLKMIKATDITFKRRSIQHDSFGKMQHRYDACNVEHINDKKYEQFSSIKSGYDWCILSIIDEENYYAKFAANITIRPTAEICDKFARFNIFGYPCYKPNKFLSNEEAKKETQTNKRIANDGMYGMPSNQTRKMSIKYDDMGTMNHFLYQTCIDTEGGQSGAAVFTENKYLNNSCSTKQGVTIWGIHVGGSAAKKFNVGTLITNDILCKIYDICGAKTAISKVDETDIKSNDTWNPLNGKTRKEFKAHVGIDFSVDGIGVGVGFPSGEVIWQESQLNNPNIKEKPSILLQCKPSYKLIAFGVEATEKYESIQNQNVLYFDNFVASFHHIRYEDEKESKDNNEQKKEVSELQAENEEFVPTKIVFTIAMEYMKKNILKTLKKIADTDKVEDVQWILTIPYFWSEQKYIMLEVMQEVKITNNKIVDHVLLTTHPQSCSIVARERYNFQEGTKYILFDVEQETSYIACHIVTDNMSKHIYPAQVVELGLNSVCRAFYDKLKEMFGKTIDTEFALKYHYRWIMMKQNVRNAALLYDGSNQTNLVLDTEFIKFVEKKHGKCMEDIVEEYDEKLGTIEFDEDVVELSTEIVDQFFAPLVELLIRKCNRIRRAKAMEGCQDILLIGHSMKSRFLPNKLQTAYSEERVHTIPQQYLASMEGAIKIGLRTLKYISPKTVGIQVVDSGFCSFVQKGKALYSFDSYVQWFKTCNGIDQKQITIKLYSSDEQHAIQSKDSCEGIGFVQLPKNWKHHQPIAILYLDKYTEKKLYVANKNWPVNEREIRMEWNNELGW